MESDNGPLFHSLEFSPQEMPEFSLRIEGVVYYYTKKLHTRVHILQTLLQQKRVDRSPSRSKPITSRLNIQDRCLLI